MIARLYFRLRAVGRLAAAINVDASAVMGWDAGVVEGLMAAHTAFETAANERAEMEAARAAAAARQ